MYLMNGEQFPKVDPITSRSLCHKCWNGQHAHCGEMFTTNDVIMCDHFANKSGGRKQCECTFECDCHHISEAHFADIEQKNIADNRAAKKSLLASMLKDEANPLRAESSTIKRPWITP